MYKVKLIASALAFVIFCGLGWLAYHAPPQQKGYAYRGAGWWRYQIPPSAQDDRAWAIHVDPILAKADKAMVIGGAQIVMSRQKFDPDSDRFRDALLHGH